MLRKKLLARRGETLTEVLVAILVCGFSILLLVGMITTSMGINQRAREMDEAFFAALTQVETHVFDGGDPTCTVKLAGSGALPDIELTARRYTNTDAGLTVYGEVSP